MSLRVPKSSLVRDIPWLDQIAPGELRIIDSLEDQRKDAVRAEEPSARIPPSGEGTKAGATGAFSWLPQELQADWSAEVEANPKLVVFDSWDSLVDGYLSRGADLASPLPPRAEIERRLLATMARGNILLVLVVERDSPSELDYQVNGIVETSRRLEEGRLERWLGLPKLRGVPIPTDIYPFTLVHGRFAAITANPAGVRLRMNPPVPDPQPDAPGLWPGSTDFAQAFGRLRLDALALFELESSVPREVSRVLLGPTIIHTLRQGGKVVILPPPSLDPEDAFVSLRDHLPPEVLRDQLTVVSPIPLESSAAPPPGRFGPLHKLGWPRQQSATAVPESDNPPRIELGSKVPNLIVAYLSGLEALTEGAGIPFGRSILGGLAREVFPHSPVVVAAFGRTGNPHFPAVSTISELHVRIRCPHGRIFLNGHRPYLAPLVLSHEPGTEPYHLTQVL